MTLARREALIAAGAAVIAAGGLAAVCIGSLKGAGVALIALLLGSIGLQLLALRRITLRQQSLDRLEQKLDLVARRVVTEAAAANRELGGRIDELAAEVRRQS